MWIRFVDWPLTPEWPQPQSHAPVHSPIRHRRGPFIGVLSSGFAESARLSRLRCEVQAIWPELQWEAFLVTTHDDTRPPMRPRSGASWLLRGINASRTQEARVMLDVGGRVLGAWAGPHQGTPGSEERPTIFVGARTPPRSGFIRASVLPTGRRAALRFIRLRWRKRRSAR